MSDIKNPLLNDDEDEVIIPDKDDTGPLPPVVVNVRENNPFSNDDDEPDSDSDFSDPFPDAVDEITLHQKEKLEEDSTNLVDDKSNVDENDPFSYDPFSDNTDDVDLDDWEDEDDLQKEPTSSKIKTVTDFSSVVERDDNDDDTPKLDLDAIVTKAIDMGASDIHLSPFDNVTFTVLGEIRRVEDFGVIDPNMTVELYQRIISNVLEQAFVEDLELDTSYVVKSGKHKGRRLRLSVGKTEGNIFLVFRVIADVIPTPDELNIPHEIREWTSLPNGLILVNGPTGSGKSTTLSSLIQEIQFQRAEKIITVEKPIEYVYGKKEGQKAFITQREVGKDTREFSSALTSAMRQAPDIILVGEVRNRLEIDELLRAAETGHLAISTLHTTSCASTLNRISSMYDGDEKKRVLSTLADNLRGMVNQTLVLSSNGKKRFAVHEVLQITRDIKDMILNGDVDSIKKHMEDNGSTMEHELVKAVKAKKTTVELARRHAPDPLYFDEILYEGK